MATKAPYGDIFYVNTPTIDRWAQQMYVEQRQREAKQQQENAMLDANIQKEIGKVRSVDTPDVISSYNNYKQLKKQLLFNKDLQKDPLAYNAAQLAAQKAYQDVFTTANKSAELKEMQKNLTTDRIKNTNAYSDDFGERMAILMNTPISKLTTHPVYGDLTNMDSYMYKGSNTDFGKILKDAAGQPKQVYTDSKILDGGLQTQLTPYMFGNSPAQVRDYLLGSMAVHQTGRDAAYQWDKLPEKEIQETIKAYQSLPKEYWQRIGVNDTQDLLPKNPNNKAENFASYQAMKYAIANQPKEGTPVFRENKAAVMAAQESKERRMQALKQADAKELIRLRKEIDPNDTELNNVWYQSYLDKRMQEATDTGQSYDIFTTKGRDITKYKMIKPDPFLMKSLARDGREPDRVGVTEKGDIIPIFFSYTKDKSGNTVVEKLEGTNTPVVDTDYTQPMSYDQALINMGYRGRTKKQLGEDFGKGVPKSSQPSTKSFKIDGKSYTRKQLNDMGYDDKEIEDYLKQGLIK